ncbi:MAG: hypothetical protein AVDCRST_MAG73-424, partial [uncultured Thermomicrobiales bacterium]
GRFDHHDTTRPLFLAPGIRRQDRGRGPSPSARRVGQRPTGLRPVVGGRRTPGERGPRPRGRAGKALGHLRHGLGRDRPGRTRRPHRRLRAGARGPPRPLPLQRLPGRARPTARAGRRPAVVAEAVGRL